ncbi:hypothetical protein P378_03205 [Desulforamulus profundi]|uniref:Uncharacterized protein n=1 Tax=Desulforamulus profundi TaxID=1383067 RepID=A0A2C6MDQ8_9FIRM|nr:hypothetical protein P378_03205 [Desulforamulus profundi]
MAQAIVERQYSLQPELRKNMTNTSMRNLYRM